MCVSNLRPERPLVQIQASAPKNHWLGQWFKKDYIDEKENALCHNKRSICRRKVFYKKKRAAIGKILRQLYEWKRIKIIETEVCPNHIHMVVLVSPMVEEDTLPSHSASVMCSLNR